MGSIAYPLKPGLKCSVIMKGGITSGVIYPELVCRLAETYRLKSIGGSSAGAIAAAIAAAAELRRFGGSVEGFAALESLPDALTETGDGSDSRLLRLFQPQPATKPLFDALIAGLNAKAGADAPQKAPLLAKVFTQFMTRQQLKGRGEDFSASGEHTEKDSLAKVAGAVLGSLLQSFRGSGSAKGVRWTMVLPISLVALGVLSIWLAWPLGLLSGVPLILLSLLIAGLLYVADTAFALGRDVAHVLLDAVPANGLGLCSGLETNPNDANEKLALTRWLHEYLQNTAGKESSSPVTFGDLEDAGINLRVMTTNLTQGRPMAMPWQESGFFFEKAAWQRLFPSEVIDRLILSTPNNDVSTQSAEFRALRSLARTQGLYPLPGYRDLPILVAVRMSLSFPVLISAVPLKAIDWSLQANQAFRDTLRTWLKSPGHNPDHAGGADPVTRPVFNTNWFTDGGLCANLPVHFFDRALATEPTFAVNLQQRASVEDDATDEGGLYNSDVPYRNNDGLGRAWNVWEREPNGETGQPTLTKFVGALASTLMGWVDNEALRMPGYRDRIATIFHTKDEGGMNLNMSGTTVERLAARGRSAGGKLADKFTGPFPEGAVQTNGFDNHRWIRLRDSLAGLGEWLEEFHEDYASDAPGAKSFEDMLAGVVSPPAYPDSQESLSNLAASVNDLAATLSLTRITRRAPNPRGRLRLVPYDRPPASSH